MAKKLKKTPKAPQTDELYRLVMEAAPNAMVMADQRGKIVLVNNHAEKLFGYPRAEMLGKPVELLVPLHARRNHHRHRENYSSAPETRAMGAGRDLFGLHRDGREIPIEIGLNPIRTKTETFVLAAIVDITERQELQRRIAQNEALAAVGSMAAVMAHEIRNPLGSIVMAAKSLGREDLSPADRKMVGAVLSEESQRLSRTLQDFLQYARPREPKRDLADFNKTVTEIIHALKSDAGLVSQVELDISLDKNLSPFPHDSDQLRQVLWNLILNAIQAMDGKGLLKIRTEAKGAQAFFCIIDSGPGLSAQAIEKIFDPFYTTKKKGTGLGLAIARRIIKAHQGDITAENDSKAGARFSIVLPTSANK